MGLQKVYLSCLVFLLKRRNMSIQEEMNQLSTHPFCNKLSFSVEPNNHSEILITLQPVASFRLGQIEILCYSSVTWDKHMKVVGNHAYFKGKEQNFKDFSFLCVSERG